MILANHAGLTPHGKAWYEHTAQEAPDRKIDLTQTHTRIGSTEYAVNRQGQKQRLRTLLPTGDWKYYAAGSYFFGRGPPKTEYEVHVPVVVEGLRRNGTPYKHITYLPTSLMGMDRIMANTRLSHAARIAKVKSQVLQHMDVRTENGRTVLLDFE